MPETVFASARDWTPTRLQDTCEAHGVVLTDPGKVIHNGEVVGSYELANGVLVFRDIHHDSPLIEAFEMGQVS